MADTTFSNRVQDASQFDLRTFNNFGKENNDFIDEVNDSMAMKKQDIMFALFVDGVAGDPSFGCGVSGMIGDGNTNELQFKFKSKMKALFDGLVDGIKFKSVVVNQIPEQQLVSVDVSFIDVATQQQILIPLGVSA